MPKQTFSCQDCSRIFKNRGTLNNHLSRARRGLVASCNRPAALQILLKQNVCDACQKQFKTIAGLRLHRAAAKNGRFQSCDGNTTFSTIQSDCQSTPVWLWQELLNVFPSLENTRVWDPFYNDGASSCRMREAGLKRIRHTKMDFFAISHKWQTDLIVSNPPFSIKSRILKHLFTIDRAFVLLLPVRTLFTKYFQPWRHRVKLIMPTKAFMTTKLSVDCVFVCYNCGPPVGITWCV
jgi:hypothetical protein